MAEACHWKPTILNSCGSRTMTDASLCTSTFTPLSLCFSLSVKTVEQICPLGNSPDLNIPYFLCAAARRSGAGSLVCDTLSVCSVLIKISSCKAIKVSESDRL